MQLNLQASIAPPQAWADPLNDPLDCRSIANIEVQITGTPSTAYTPMRSLDGKVYFSCTTFDSRYSEPAVVNGNVSISAEGIYILTGGGFLKFGAGGGSTVTVRGSNT